MINKSYTNHHPFWHTKWMEMIVKPVYEMTGEGNIAIYVFGIFQIMIMSIVFVYAVDTIWEMGLSKKWIVAIIIGYSLSPYNVGISVGILKDAAFSIALSLMLVALVRLINDCGKYRYIDFILLATGVLGSCLFRTNGMIVVMVTVPFTWILFAKEKKSIPITITTVFVFAFLLNKIYMNVNDIPQPDTVESLSIPLQQIARTSMDQKEISEQAKEYLDIVVGYDKLAEAYVSDISDSVKNIIRNEGNQQYLTDHKLEFIKVWIDIGIHHPFNYLKGWVDQTRGYWGPSYCFWGGLKGIVIETNGFMNFHKVSNDNIVRHIWDMWEKLLITDFIPGFEIIFSQGIRLWILVFCLIYSFFHNRKNTIVCLIPIAVVFTLVIATPVCYEFRYAYPIYEMFMLVVLATLRCNRVNNNT